MGWPDLEDDTGADIQRQRRRQTYRDLGNDTLDTVSSESERPEEGTLAL